MEQITLRDSVKSLKQLAYNATQQTSFHPERRGEELMMEAEQGLRSLLSQLPDTMHEYAEQKYISLYSSWLSAMSRCFSVMITGAARFNNKRHERCNNAEHNAYQRLIDWQKRIVSRANRHHRLTGWDEVARLEDKIEGLEELQETMKQANKIVRSKKLADVEKIDELVALGIKEKYCSSLIEGDSWHKPGFASYQLTNNNAKIKQAKLRLAQLVAQLGQGDKEIEFDVMGGGHVEICADDERIRIYFNDKPSTEDRDRIKGCAFKWSPSNVCWQRQLTPNAKRATEQLLEITL